MGSGLFPGWLGSLRARVTLGTIAVLTAGIGLIAFVLVQRAEHETLRDQRQRELVEVMRTARLLSRNVVDLQKALGVVAAQLPAAALASDLALAQFFEGKPVLRSLFSNVFVARPDGQLAFYFDRQGAQRLQLSIADRPYFQRTLAERRAIVSEPLPSRVSGLPVVVLTQPLQGAGGVHAVLAGALNLSERDLLSQLVQAEDLDGQALTVVTDAQGKVLAHPDAGWLMLPLADEPRLAGAFRVWTGQGSPVEPSGLQLQQAGDVVSAAGVPGADWMVWRFRPHAELLAPLHAARREATAWAAGLIVVVSLLTFALLSWLLHPLRLLERRSRLLFGTDLPADQGWPQAGGEIGRLGQVLKEVSVSRGQLEASNKDLLNRLVSVLAASPTGIAFVRNERVELVSTEFCRLLGQSESSLRSAHPSQIFAAPEDFGAIRPRVLEAFAKGRTYAGEWKLVRSDGSHFWAQLRSSPVDGADATAGTIWTITDISEQKVAHDQLEWSAGHDPLTGLANRREFELRARSLIEALPGSLPAAIVFIDLDHFKPVNDEGGHAAGDAMLNAVAQAISASVRSSDLVARIGGDEFALLLEDCRADTAVEVAQAVRGAVAAVRLTRGVKTFAVGASLGVASLASDMASVQEWIGAADAACYDAKSRGRGEVCVAPVPEAA